MGSKVISFRLDDDKLALLEQHKQGDESPNQTAMRLLLGVLGVEAKKTRIQGVDTVDIEKLIEEKIVSVNAVNSVDIEAIIKRQIAASILQGDIREAINKSSAAMMEKFNGLLEELQELKSISAAAVPHWPLPITEEENLANVPSLQSPITNPQLSLTEEESPIPSPQSPITDDLRKEIIKRLEIEGIINGEFYTDHPMSNNLRNAFTKIVEHRIFLSQKLGINIISMSFCKQKDLHKILKEMGYSYARKKVGGRRGYKVINYQKN
jgi:hypothetical protein